MKLEKDNKSYVNFQVKDLETIDRKRQIANDIVVSYHKRVVKVTIRLCKHKDYTNEISC